MPGAAVLYDFFWGGLCFIHTGFATVEPQTSGLHLKL